MAEFLPNDYYEKYRQYRWDLPLRRDYQRAAFDAGWLQPTWPREHGGRSLCLRDAMEVRLEAALRSAPKLPNIAGPNVAAPGGSIGFLWMMAAHREGVDRQFGVVNVQPEYAANGSGLEAYANRL